MNHTTTHRLCSIFALLLAAGIPAAGALSASDLEQIIPAMSDADSATLLREGSVTRFFTSVESPRLLPQSPLSGAILASMTSLPYTIGVETVFIAPLPPGNDRARLTAWYNVLRSISTLKGVRYYSTLFGRKRVLFRDSYVVAGENDLRRVADPLVADPPADSTIYIRQDDSTFGPFVAEVRYRASERTIAMSMTSETLLKLLLVPVVRPGDMQLQLVVMPYRGSLLFYGCVVVKVLTYLGMEGMIRDSFDYRIEALYGWFRRMARYSGA